MLDHNTWPFFRRVLPQLVGEYGRSAWALRCRATKRVEQAAAPLERCIAEAADMRPRVPVKPAEIERGEGVERLGPATAGELTHGGGRAGGLLRGGGATRRLIVVAIAAALLLSVVMLVVQSQGSPAQAATNCKGIDRTVTYRDRVGSGQPLAYFRVSQIWCWDGRAVTYASKPKVSGKVTKLGAAQGWRYDGVLGKRGYYFTHKGLSRGGHTSIREGGFTVCAKNTPCSQKEQRVKIFVYHDGNGYSVARA